jgi:hypothetical protein
VTTQFGPAARMKKAGNLAMTLPVDIDMRRKHALNKEKLAFLAAVPLVCAALYFFISSAPRRLELSRPTTRQSGPEPNECLVPLAARRPIDALVDNGEPRNSPFEPYRPVVVEEQKKKEREIPGITPSPADERKEAAKTDLPIPSIASEVDYMGVVVDGEPHALLKPKNGTAPFLVAKGSKIPNYDYTVSKIEPQAIEIVDNKQRPFTLKDQTFEKGGAARAR